MKAHAVSLVFVALVAIATPLAAQTYSQEASGIPSPGGEPIDLSSSIVLFYSDNCPHCHNQLRWMARIRDEFPDIAFRRFEIEASNSRPNQEYFRRMMEAYGSSARGWPRTIIGDRLFIGFAPREGELEFDERFQAWVGYQNQLYNAIEALAAGR